MEAIPVLDLRLLTQADINAMAEASSPAGGDDDDIVIPKIDRSVFNESAGSRRQTYSRLRLAPRKPSHLSRSGYSYSHYSSASAAVPPDSNPAAQDNSRRLENKEIIKFLLQLFSSNGIEVRNSASVSLDGIENHPEKELGEASPKPNVIVDSAMPWTNQDLFEEKLGKMTEGMGTEEQLLAFLGGLEGRWASSRKRRKIVNASNFASALPKGWKILLGLQRKRRSIRIYCRQYISPCGKLFSSYNEASSYLLSRAGQEDTNTSLPHEATRDKSRNIQALDSTLSDPLDLANPLKLEHQQTLSCDKCHISFADKDSEMQHARAFHRRGRKRRRPGESMTDGVILRDGAFECQFCHKSFTTRQKYQGHVGVHIRYADWGLNSPKPALTAPIDNVTEVVSKVDSSRPNGGEGDDRFLQADDVSNSVDCGFDSSKPVLPSPVDHGVETVSRFDSSCPSGGEMENNFLQVDDISNSVDFGLDSSKPELTCSIDHREGTVPRVNSSCPSGDEGDDHFFQVNGKEGNLNSGDNVSISVDFGLDSLKPELTFPIDHRRETVLTVDGSCSNGNERDGSSLLADDKERSLKSSGDISIPVDFDVDYSEPGLTFPIDHGVQIVSGADVASPAEGKRDNPFSHTDERDDVRSCADWGPDSSKLALTFPVDHGSEVDFSVDSSHPNAEEKDGSSSQTDERERIIISTGDVSSAADRDPCSSEPVLIFTVDQRAEADFTVDSSFPNGDVSDGRFFQSDEKERIKHDVSRFNEEKHSEVGSQHDGLNARTYTNYSSEVVGGKDGIKMTMPSGGNHGEMEMKMMDEPLKTRKDGLTGHHFRDEEKVICDRHDASRMDVDFDEA